MMKTIVRWRHFWYEWPTTLTASPYDSEPVKPRIHQPGVYDMPSPTMVDGNASPIDLPALP